MLKKPAKKTFTIAEAAQELGVSTNAIRKVIKKGRFPTAVKGKYEVERVIKRPILTSHHLAATTDC